MASEINPVPNFHPSPFHPQGPWKGTPPLEIGSDGGSFSSQNSLDYRDHHFGLHGSSCCDGTDLEKGKERRRGRVKSPALQRQWGLPACARERAEPAGGNTAVVRGWPELSASPTLGSFTDRVLFPLPVLSKSEESGWPLNSPAWRLCKRRAQQLKAYTAYWGAESKLAVRSSHQVAVWSSLKLNHALANWIESL